MVVWIHISICFKIHPLSSSYEILNFLPANFSLPATNVPLREPLFPNPFDTWPISGFFTDALYKTISRTNNALCQSVWHFVFVKNTILWLVYIGLYSAYFYLVSLIILTKRIVLIFPLILATAWGQWIVSCEHLETTETLDSLRKRIFILDLGEKSSILPRVCILFFFILFYLALVLAFRLIASRLRASNAAESFVLRHRQMDFHPENGKRGGWCFDKYRNKYYNLLEGFLSERIPEFSTQFHHEDNFCVLT